MRSKTICGMSMETEITDWASVERAKEGKRRRRNGNDIVTIVSKKHMSISEDPFDESFLPGIPNHITMAHIVAKLSWTNTLKMASVSRAWQHGIRSHHFHAERVWYGSTKTYIVLPYFAQPGGTTSQSATISIALYSMDEGRCYELPALPPFYAPRLGSYWCTCVALAGKVYVIEFNTFDPIGVRSVTSRMMRFDVAGQGGWQPCANLHRTEDRFQCYVLNGKIYAIGGADECVSLYNISTATEVYSPEDNSWSLIELTKYYTRRGVVWALGDMLLLRHCRDKHGLLHDNMDMYNPFKDRCTKIELSLLRDEGLGFNRDTFMKMFTLERKFYIMDRQNIYILDSTSAQWKSLHTSSFTEIGMGPSNALNVCPLKVQVIDEELVAIVCAKLSGSSAFKILALRSKDPLGGESREIVWQRANTDALTALEGGMGGALRI